MYSLPFIRKATKNMTLSRWNGTEDEKEHSNIESTTVNSGYSHANVYIYIYLSLSFWVSSCFNKPILSLICRFQKAFSMCSSAVLLWKMKLRLSQHLSAAVQRLGSWFSLQGLAKRRTRGNSECIPNEPDVLKLWTPTANPLFFWCAVCVCACAVCVCVCVIRFLLLHSETIKNIYFFIFFIFIVICIFMSFCWVNLNIIFSIYFSFFRFRSSPFAIKLHFFHFQLHFFSFATSFFCIFLSFSFVFDGFPLFFIDFHGFPGFQVPRARKMKKNDNKNVKSMINKWNSSFWRFPGSEWESATLSPNFHLFFICNFSFFRFPLFLVVFDCFSLIFMVFLDFRFHGQGKWKKMKFEMKKMMFEMNKMKFEEPKTKKKTKMKNKWKQKID